MENLLNPYPFGLESAGSTYQDAVHHLFIDHTEHSHISDLYAIDPTDSDQPSPVVNVVAIRQLIDDSPNPTKSLHNILNESPDESSEGSTQMASSCPTFPLGFGGMIFHVSWIAAPKMVKPLKSVKRIWQRTPHANAAATTKPLTMRMAKIRTAKMQTTRM